MAVKFTLSWILVLFLGFVGSAQNSTQRTSRMTNDDVLELVKAGISSDIIVAKIKSAECHFETSPATLKSLKQAKRSRQCCSCND